MPWSGTYSHNFLLAIDLWAAEVIFNRAGITISSMAGLVRDGQDETLHLWRWQHAFLAWLEPRLSQAHCVKARAADLARAQLVISLLQER